MSDDLRDGLRAAAGRGATRPELGVLWRAGRRRRVGRRMLGAAAVAIVALAVGAAVAVASSGTSDRQDVRTADVPTTVDGGRCSPVPRGEGDRPPATIDELVHGPAGPGATAPTVLARGTVRDVRWFGPSELGTDPASWYHVVVVEVTDPIEGADAGELLDVLDVDPVAPGPLTDSARDDIASRRQDLQRQVEDRQRAVDEIDLPLAELDEQLLAMQPDDPRYEVLMGTRQTLKERTDADREAAQTALSDLKEDLQRLQLAEDRGLSPNPPVVVAGPPCHLFEVGDDVIVALVPGDSPEIYRLATPSSFFVVDGDRLSGELDAARASVDGWSDSDLLALARRSTPDQFLDRLRQAAAN